MTNFPEVKGSDNLHSAIFAEARIRVGMQPSSGFAFKRAEN